MTCSSTYHGTTCTAPITYRISFCCPCGAHSPLYGYCDTCQKRVRAGRHEVPHKPCGFYASICEVHGPSSLGHPQTSDASPAGDRVNPTYGDEAA